MKKLLGLLVIASLILSVMPLAFANAVGGGIAPNIDTEDFEPLVWMCGDRIVADDLIEPGRISLGGEEMIERINNYAFEGESITWTVLVMDKNGNNKIQDVFATIGDAQGFGNDIEVNCIEGAGPGVADPLLVDPSCNARIGEELLDPADFNARTMDYYTCTLTVETADSMYGEYWVTVEALDLDGLSGIMAENEYWFFNPVIALAIDGDMTFENVRPGTAAYSPTILVGNDADAGSGVMMDMFISGTDFYDSSSSGTMCPTTNQLNLQGPGFDGNILTIADNTGFRYFATNGAYSTRTDLQSDLVVGDAVQRMRDAEGYVNIEYGVGFNDPYAFYNNAEILQAQLVGPYYEANVLAPGAEMALTFKLMLPEPCNGDFDTGSIYFWGEAI